MHDFAHSSPQSRVFRIKTGERVERRSSHRPLLTATAEVVELRSGSRLVTRTVDVSQGGCFIDRLLPLPVGSPVRVFLLKDGQRVHADGTVTYCQPGLGIGVVFTNLIPEHKPVLQAWLAQASGQPHTDHGLLPKHSKQERAAESERIAARKLIHLLVARGVLTEAEGASLLSDPII